MDGRAVRVTTVDRVTRVLGVQVTIGAPRTDDPPSFADAGPGRIATADRVAVPTSGYLTASPGGEREGIPDQVVDGIGVLRDLADRLGAAAQSLLRTVARWEPALPQPVSEQPETPREPADPRKLVTIPFCPCIRRFTGTERTAPTLEANLETSPDVSLRIASDALPAWADLARLVCLPVADDAMEGTVNNGDLVAVDPGHATPLENHPFALVTDVGVTLRRLRFRNGWILTADNPAWSDRPLSRGDHLLGRVAWRGPRSRSIPTEN